MGRLSQGGALGGGMRLLYVSSQRRVGLLLRGRPGRGAQPSQILSVRALRGRVWAGMYLSSLEPLDQRLLTRPVSTASLAQARRGGPVLSLADSLCSAC